MKPHLILMQGNTGDGNILASSRGLRSRSGRVYQVPAERVEYGSRIYSSGRLSVSQREYQLKMSPSPSTLSFTDSSSTTFDGQLEEFSLKMARRSSRRYSASPENKHQFIIPSSQGQVHMPSNSTMFPNYMTNTRSSQAKARSHSEPRQRPKHKGRRSSSMDGKNDKQTEYPWLSKLYRADKSTDEGDCNSSINAMAVISKHIQSLVPFEGVRAVSFSFTGKFPLFSDLSFIFSWPLTSFIKTAASHEFVLMLHLHDQSRGVVLEIKARDYQKLSHGAKIKNYIGKF